MTRLFFVLLLVASASFGQTYVRPSKGTPIIPFTASSWAGAPMVTNGANFNIVSSPYDWSAFEAVRVHIYTTGGGANAAGASCADQSLSFSLAEIAGVLRLNLIEKTAPIVGSRLTLNFQDAPAPTAPFKTMQTTNASVTLNNFVGCNLVVQLTPLPFAPAAQMAVSYDGGSAAIDVNATVNVSVTTSDGGMPISAPYCTQSRSSASSVGTSVVAMPADGGLAGRWMVRLCNSPRNSGTPIVTCSVLTVPDAGTLSDGEALEVGDCATWTTGEQVYCISDTASTAVSSWECR